MRLANLRAPRQRSRHRAALTSALMLVGVLIICVMIFPPHATLAYLDLSDDRSAASILGSLLILFTSIAFGLLAVAAFRATTESNVAPEFLGWGFLAAAFLLLAIIDLFHLQVRFMFEVLLGAAIASVLLLFVWRLPPGQGQARVLIALAIVLLATNPGTDYLERRLVSDPTNYTFVADGRPYAFNANADRQLDLIQRVQEGTEIVAMLCLVAACWSYRESRSHCSTRP